ncbi:DUF4349 domain-containing protein [Cohnella endophytica]|uniref:DUF4349 domain-containing protein n=1 Tax=Cohnella endophytica TaxID=2419778 RepID=A0A494Y5Q9_9BACL|nr:DUF4349 domain-containing protein [Cohnella endophytica]RKP55260.1 DUF4349 domain-containing protein [Cohnella endophytica]
MKRRWGRSLRSMMLFALVTVLAMGLTACGSSSSDNANSGAAAKSEDRSNAMAAEAPRSNAAAFSEAKSQAGAEQLAESSSAPVASASVDLNTVGGGGIGQIADANAGFGRKVIYRANLVMKVEEFKSAEEQLTNLIHLGGAYVLQFSDSRNADEVGATYVIKVPSEGFSPFLEKLQRIKNLKYEREVEGNDVTEEYVDLDARLKAKQVVETRLLSFMDKATKTDDLVRFSNELARVQEEIEQIKGRTRFLDQNVAFSTINLRLYQSTGLVEVKEEKKEEPGKSFGDRIGDALGGSVKVLRQFGEGLLIVVAAILPVLIVILVIGVPTYFILRKRTAERKKLAEERRKTLNAPRISPAVPENAVSSAPASVESDPEASPETSKDEQS